MAKFIIAGVVIIAIAAFFLMRDTTPAPAPADEMPMDEMEGMEMEDSTMMEETAPPTNTTTPTPSTGSTTGAVKEFAMDSYYDDKGAWFSVKEIRVNKGDRVRITVTNTRGMHDFALDEFGIKKETPLNEKTVIEFTADKAGTFEYYCSKPGHRARGQFGKLIVS